MGVTIGKNCFISRKAFLDIRRGKIIIGDYVNIAPGSFVLSHTARQPIKEGQVTRLEDNVLIFVNAVIFPGVKVGKNSVVGAGAVVTRDIPPDVTVMGNPARVVWPKGNRPRD
jgi:acetyltransferase-like isoleucine patch superfamily enzyme